MLKGKVKGILVFSLIEAVDVIMRDNQLRSPKEIMAELEKWNVRPSLRGIHKVICKMERIGALRKIKYGKYEYIPARLPDDVIVERMMKSAIRLQELEDKNKETYDVKNKDEEKEKRERLAKLFAEGKLFTKG